MKTVFSGRFFAVFAIIMVFGLSMTSCDDLRGEDTPSLIGTWDDGLERVTFNDDNTFRYFISGKGNVKGTYTSTKSHVCFIVTHYLSSSATDNWAEVTSVVASQWPWFDGRELSYEIKQKKNSSKYYLNISGMSYHGTSLPKQ